LGEPERSAEAMTAHAPVFRITAAPVGDAARPARSIAAPPVAPPDAVVGSGAPPPPAALFG
jgi:hypothetical protein